jgi:hypothetical protein
MKVLQSHVACTVVVLSLPIAGCALRTHRASVSPPQGVAEEPAPPESAANPVEPTPRQSSAANPVPNGTTSAPSGTIPAASPTPAAPSATIPAPNATAALPSATTPAEDATTAAASGTTAASKLPHKTGPPVKKTPAPNAQLPKLAAPPVALPAAPPAPVPLDLIALKEQLKATKAIGLFTKISLKNQVDDLMAKFRNYYQGKGKTTMPELRRSYDLLIMKVLTLLQDSDKKLASKVVSSREAIWALLSDRKKFATLDS